VLHLHRSERADALVEPLAVVLAEPPDDPFVQDVVAVPTRGVERWLAQRLSHHLGAGSDGEAGVCAGVEFGSPARLVSDVLATVLEIAPDDDPWRAERLVWPLLEVVDESMAEPWCGALARHLGAADDDDIRRGRRLGVAQHLARLFTSYATQRPELLRAWAGGQDNDGTGQPVPADLAWQRQLWCRLHERLGVPSPAERLDDAVRLLGRRPELVALPSRLSVFGPTRLPEDQLRVLSALSGHRDIHLWLPHPSPALWDKVRAAAPTSRRRREVVGAAAHPLLASMARDATELQLRLTALDAAAEGAVDEHHPAPPPPATLLGALRTRLRDDDGGTVHRHALEPDDRSVQVHACHGRSRQVEVLREVLVGLFADDPTLEPRDVIVMCPDIEAVAPLVTATFGLASDTRTPDQPAMDGHALGHPGHLLRVRLADRSLRQTNPLLSLLATVLELADGRVTASQVLDLAATEPVRRRFRFADDELDRLRDWAQASGVHWGEDLARRARFGLPDLGQGTWNAALDRLLLGAAMAEEDHRFVGSALPLDDVDSTDIDLAGRFAELLDRLADVLSALDRTVPLGDWLDQLDRALDLLADTRPGEAWQAVQARQVLSEARLSGSARVDLPLRLPDVRALLAGRLQGRPTRAGFRTGALTMCSLEPMRAVPHRVVCLLGLDDDAFPRGGRTDGDDVLLRDPCLGERDRRSEDRQLYLDAVLAAREHLVVVYTGADERTGAVRPPAVPVSELLDALDRAATAADDRPVRDHVVVRHPLQAVEERNFAAAALGRPGPFSFDDLAHRAARAGRAPRAQAPPFLREPLPGPEPLWRRMPGRERVPAAGPAPAGSRSGEVLDLDDLVTMLEHPVKWFLRQRLQVSVAGETDEVEDRLPLKLQGLDEWAIGQRLLGACLAGVDERRARAAEWRRGEVPPKALGAATLDAIVEKVVPIAGAAQRYAVGPATVVDVTAALPSGVLTGTVPGVHGEVVVRTTYSRLAPKHRLRAWVQLLALSADHGGAREWRAVTVGRAQGTRPRAAVARLRAPDPNFAAERLEELVQLRRRALREPLPMPVAAACAYAQSRHGGDLEVQALESARRVWRSAFEDVDRHHALCWGEGMALDALLDAPNGDEAVWWPEEGTRLGVLARRVWAPLLDHEETETV
jgi:exodeoxyribonuclease V gamma subunit